MRTVYRAMDPTLLPGGGVVSVNSPVVSRKKQEFMIELNAVAVGGVPAEAGRV
jgi:hypothetical protein